MEPENREALLTLFDDLQKEGDLLEETLLSLGDGDQPVPEAGYRLIGRWLEVQALIFRAARQVALIERPDEKRPITLERILELRRIFGSRWTEKALEIANMEAWDEESGAKFKAGAISDRLNGRNKDRP